MKAFKIGLLVFLITSMSFSCAKKKEMPFPKLEEVARARPGELILKTGIYEVKGKIFRADFGTLIVPENRKNPASRTIHLPVVRIRAATENPAEPVFLLSGGPGLSNIWKSPPDWLLTNHDLVMVGYRGVDGSVSLDCPEIGQALKAKNPLSGENLKKLGQACYAAFNRLKSEGIDIDGYTMVDVVDDLEACRRAFGFKKINLFARSYGTRVAYIYALRYPESIHRSVMIGVNPPGHFIWDPEMVERQLKYYAELWRKDEKARLRAPDLLETIKKVFELLPRQWLVFRIDPDKVKIMTFMLLYHRNSAAQVFDAFVAAERGDPSGLAVLSFMYDRMIPKAVNWGDNLSKVISADYDPNRDYEAEMIPPEAILGSPMSKILGGMKYGGWPIKPMPEEYRKLQFCDTETLLFNGNIDFSTPVEYAQDELLPYLRRGRLVVLAESGHCDDVMNLQPEAFEHLVKKFYDEGIIDDSQFHYEPMNFSPATSLPEMAKRFVRKIAYLGSGAAIALIFIILSIVWIIKRAKKSKSNSLR